MAAEKGEKSVEAGPSAPEDKPEKEEGMPDEAKADEAQPEDELAAAKPPLNNLCILPPRQKPDDGKDDKQSYRLPLPPIRPEEPVLSLRLAMAEVVGLAHYTNYRIEVETAAATDKPTMTEDEMTLPLVSPFTGQKAVVCIPAALQSLDKSFVSASPPPQDTPKVEPKDSSTDSVVLDEFSDLQSCEAVQDGAALRIVLERYDSSSVKEHIVRLRHLLHGNAPAVTSLVDDAAAAAMADESKPEPSAAEGESSPVTAEEGGEKPEKTKPLPDLPILQSARVDGSNLRDFFYLCSGEDPVAFDRSTLGSGILKEMNGKAAKKKKSKAIQKIGSSKQNAVVEASEEDVATLPPSIVRDKLFRLNQLEGVVHVHCTIQYSGFHPPPPVRRMMGDIAYLEVSIPEKDNKIGVVHITAGIFGFYVNRTYATINGKYMFDPSPAPNMCFSHTLLDCLLQASPSFAGLWKDALEGSKERSDITSQINKGAFPTLFRLAVRGEMGGCTDPTFAIKSSMALDSTIRTPSWLVKLPKVATKDNQSMWNPCVFHEYRTARAEEEVSQTFGVDVRNGALRDWNEELQLAREMPTSTLVERVERARVIHKTMTEYGEAALLAVKAISDGHISPMNPNEGTRTQVYLHNNIFVSRALDVGPETFRLVKGDRAAKKAAGREIQCIKTFHRMEGSGFHTLATVLIDYLGSRFICQSILPGILQGEKSHTILLGSVDIEIPMKCDEEFHSLLQEKVGEALNLLDRPVYTSPLTAERLEECKKLKSASLLLAGIGTEVNSDQEVDMAATMNTCAPLETKGIRGSDQRKYLLDFGRMTPRDANWVPEKDGGTGRWEGLLSKDGTSSGSTIPSAIKDEEWTLNVLRPELINQWIRSCIQKYMEAKRKEHFEAEAQKKKDAEGAKTEDGKKGNDEKEKSEGDTKDKDEKQQEKFEMTEEDQKALTDSMRLNINVFLPDVRVVDPEQMKADEEKVKEAAVFLFDEVLPRVTRMIRDGVVSTLPVGGKSLTEFLHRNGVNCRYLGRLATLAIEEEKRDMKTNDDLKNGRVTVFSRRTMPLSWLELLECEMVARAAKHVLDTYLMERGGAATAQPVQLIASFLSALVSEREETAAQTETRLEKSDASIPDEDDLQAFAVFDVGGEGDALPSPAPSRYQVWKDVDKEIGRRFRYSLTLFNNGNKSGRANHIPLLRRICQRIGVRLVAKNYDVGGKCYTEGNTAGGRLTASYPISPVDIVDIVPMMKHTAAYHEGFLPCALNPVVVTPLLQISLYDAKAALERAHFQMNSRGLSRALELAQEAASLYQRVTENGAHPAVVDCVELMANVFLEANDPSLAISNGAKALGLAVQSGGFDGQHVFNIHILLFQMLFAARQFDVCVKHLRAAMYILEISCGPRHIEHYDALHKLGALYSYEDYNGKYSAIAVKIFRELERLDPTDRLLEGFTLRALAKSLAQCGEFKNAVEAEKRANKSLARFVSNEHAAMKESDGDLKKYTEMAVREGNRSEEKKVFHEEELKAEAIAANLMAEEDSKKKKQTGNKKKKGKK